MKITTPVYLGLLTCSLLSFSQHSFAAMIETVAPAIEELNADDQEKVKNEQQVAVFKEVVGEAWPKSWVYQYVKATPEEAAAVFFDYNRHHTFFPDCNESSVVQQLDQVTFEVKYKISLPWPLSSETYTVYDKLITYDTPAGMSYRIEWNLKEETSKTKRLNGNIRMEPLGQGTLIAYYNFITPNISGASWFVGQAKDKVKAMVKATAEKIQKETTSERALLDQQIAQLRKALAH